MQTHCAVVTCDSMWVTSFLLHIFEYISTKLVYLQCCLVVTWLVPRETAAISAHSVYTMQACTVSCHFMQSHIHRVHVCLAVTCHLHFWQNDQDLFHAVEVERYWNMSQHRKLTMEKKILLPGLKTCDHSVWCSNHRAIPTSLPKLIFLQVHCFCSSTLNFANLGSVYLP